MSIASEITRLQNSKADVKTQVNIDKDLINGGTAFIDDETVDDYDDKIEEMQEAYKKFIPIQTTSGTEITLDNSNNDKVLVDIGLDGNTEQFTTTGKNFFSPFDTTTQTLNGVERTTNADGSITLTGTATANSYFRVTNDITLESNTTYTTLNQNSNTPNGVTIYYNNLVNIGLTYNDTVISPNGRLKVYTTGSVTGTISIAILVQSGVTVNATLYPMLVKGTVTDSNIPNYEPYTGGIASPNPSYPSEVKTVTGENTINIVSKNQIGLLSDFVANNSSLQVTTTSASITVTHTTTQAWIGIYKEFDNLIPNSTMTLSVKGVTTTTTGYSMTVRNSGGQVVQEVIRQASGSRASFSFTVPSDGKIIIRLYAGYGDVQIGDTATYSELQLENGTTVTPYVPYQSQSYPISLASKNYCDGILEAGGIATSTGVNEDLANRIRTKNMCKIPSGQITISVKETDLSISIRCYDNSKAYLGVAFSGWGTLPNTFTPLTNTRYIRFVFKKTNDSSITVNSVTEIQVESGSSATSYEPYWQIELCKIGNYKDYIYRNATDGKWFKHKEVGKIKANGTENISLVTTGSNYARFNMTLTGVILGTSSTYTLIRSNYYTPKYAVEPGNIFISSTQKIVSLIHNSVITLADYKTWLGTNTPEIYYVLATPIEEEITNEALIEQLEAVKLLSGTQNNFTIDADTLPTLNLNYIGEANPHL